MPRDFQSLREANNLLDRHGKDALLVAAVRAKDCLVANDQPGCLHWLAMIKVLSEIVSDVRPDDATLH